MKKLTGLAVALAVMAYQPLASATTTNYSFDAITSNNVLAVFDGEANLQVAVNDNTLGQVQFVFTNASTSSITGIYFDSDPLLTFASPSLVGGGDPGFNVSFSTTTPPPGFVGFAQDFGADANAGAGGVALHGVSANEWLAVNFNLGSATYGQVITALNSGEFRVGLHVQSFPEGGGSEKFVSSVPEPETYAMFLAGLGLMGFMARRRSKTS